tara:strand:- start:716 stop:1225 length:510 start_codon:yes stop_codon:yes gene_type:complete
VKKINFKIIFIFSILFFFSILIKTNKPYILSTSFEAYCTYGITGYDSYFHLTPDETWVILHKNGSITINTFLDKINEEIINNKRIIVEKFVRDIIHIKSKNTNLLNYCNPHSNLSFREKVKYSAFKRSEEIIDNRRKHRIKYTVFFFNLLLIVFFVLKLEKINLSKLSR